MDRWRGTLHSIHFIPVWHLATHPFSVKTRHSGRQQTQLSFIIQTIYLVLLGQFTTLGINILGGHWVWCSPTVVLHLTNWWRDRDINLYYTDSLGLVPCQEICQNCGSGGRVVGGGRVPTWALCHIHSTLIVFPGINLFLHKQWELNW